jgi:hypothetical protein
LRKVATVIMFLFVFGVDLGRGSAQAQDGLATFVMTSTTQFTVFLKFYSQNRPHVWPGPSEHWELNDSAPHSFVLACRIGETVCFGGGYSQDGNGSYWGVGFLGNQPCTRCCLVCGADNPAHSWVLDD